MDFTPVPHRAQEQQVVPAACLAFYFCAHFNKLELPHCPQEEKTKLGEHDGDKKTSRNKYRQNKNQSTFNTQTEHDPGTQFVGN